MMVSNKLICGEQILLITNDTCQKQNRVCIPCFRLHGLHMDSLYYETFNDVKHTYISYT